MEVKIWFTPVKAPEACKKSQRITEATMVTMPRAIESRKTIFATDQVSIR